MICRQRFLEGLLVIALVAVVRPCCAKEAPNKVRVLWAGSSSIYYHNQPKLCRVGCGGWLSCRTYRISRGMSTLPRNGARLRQLASSVSRTALRQDKISH
jgi:hypothetical protein